jgi:hypothetical protein
MSSATDRRLRLGRLESLAAVAGGVTHELSNLAASTMMSVELLAPCCRDDADRAVLAALEQLGRRIQHAGRQLHWLARGVAGERTLFQPQYLLADLQKLAAVAFPPAIAIYTRYPPDLRPLAGEPLLVFQLLLALALEARDHLAHGGSLILAARNEAIEIPKTPGAKGAKPANDAHTVNGATPPSDARVASGLATPRVLSGRPASPGAYIVLEVQAEPAPAPLSPPSPPSTRPSGTAAQAARSRRRRAELRRLAAATGARLERLAMPSGEAGAGGRRYLGRRAWLPAAAGTEL